MKILVVQNYYTPYRSALFEEMGRSDADVTVLYCHLPSDEGRKWSDGGAHGYKTCQAKYAYIGPVIISWLPRQVLKTKFDVVILNDNNPTNFTMMLWAVLLRSRCRAMLSWVEHVEDRAKSALKTAYQSLTSWMLLRQVDGVLAFSQASMRYVSRLVPSATVAVIPQAVSGREVSWTSFASREIRTFGFLGSMSARKNMAKLTAAFSSMSDPRLRLIVAGRAVEADDDRIVSVGYVEGKSKDDFFSAIDCLFLPSVSEPWGLVANEALMSGRLCAVSSSCGSAELVSQISPRLVFEPTEDGIRACLAWTSSLVEPEIRDLLAKAARVMTGYSIAASSSSILEACKARLPAGSGDGQ